MTGRVVVPLPYDRFTCRDPGDGAKRDLELTCEACGAHLCDVEPGDDLAVLAVLAAEHQCEPGEIEDDP